MTKLLRFVIMGPPGCGKGTISERIIKDFNVRHLASGDLLRHHIQNKTDVGIEAKKFVDSGKLVPDDVVIALVIRGIEELSSHSALIDGFPRTVAQAEKLDKAISVDSVLNLDVPFSVIVDRIKGRWTHAKSGRVYHTEFNPPKRPGIDDVTGEALMQRPDDKEEVVRSRLETYQKNTKPVLDFFSARGKLAVFSGSYSNQIWPHVHKHLTKYVTPLQYTDYS